MDVVVAIGGDGTVRETVLGLNHEQRARIPIGFVPMGNANVLAREVGIAWDNPDRAVTQVLEGVPRPMDVGAINGEPSFLLMLDVGLFAHVVHTVDALRKHPATSWMYGLGGDVLYGCVGLLKLLTANRAPLIVTVPGQGPFTTNALAIANASVYAKTGSHCPHADPSDAILDFNAARPGKTVRYSFAAMRGKPKDAINHLGTATHFTLSAANRGLVCQIDGDPLRGGPFLELRVAVLPSYYSLLTTGSTMARPPRATQGPT